MIPIFLGRRNFQGHWAFSATTKTVPSKVRWLVILISALLTGFLDSRAPAFNFSPSGFPPLSLCISGMLAFQLHVWAGIHETRKSRELTTILVLESWGPWPLCFLSTFQRFLVYFIYISQGFWMYLAGRIAGRKAGVPLWWIIESDSFFTMYALRMAGVIYPKHITFNTFNIYAVCVYII